MSSKPTTLFHPVHASLAEVLGQEHIEASCRACAVLSGVPVEELLKLANERVEFLPEALLSRQRSLLEKVGESVVTVVGQAQVRGASSRTFDASSHLEMAPLSAEGVFRIGEDGRLYLISKSEHYHASLGHNFRGYELIERAQRLGIPNATHNNTRGRITRLLEERLVAAANGVQADDTSRLQEIQSRQDLYVCNRVLNLETGSLAAEAALKLVLSRFYRMESVAAEPRYSGRTPVILVVGNDDGGYQANYHGTTMLAQSMRGMWPELNANLERAKVWRICSIRPNNLEDLEAAFTDCEKGGLKIAGFFHEIVMMNYGGRLLSKAFLSRAYELCRAHDVPTVCDEIQSCIWHHDLFMFREWGLTPSCVAVGKGFPGGLYPASRLIFSAALDCMPQFGALVTNGQEELASLAYLVTMRWAESNADVTRAIGDYYEMRMKEIGTRHPGKIQNVEGKRHMTTVYFHSLDAANSVARELNRRGLDISVQSYKTNCPPVLLTKLPLISTLEVVEFVISRFEEALQTAQAQEK